MCLLRKCRRWAHLEMVIVGSRPNYLGVVEAQIPLFMNMELQNKSINQDMRAIYSGIDMFLK
jgi:hypothetical protein